MTELPNGNANTGQPAADVPPPARRRSWRNRPMGLSLCGLLMGVIALGLASIPTHVFATGEEEEEKAKVKGGITFDLGVGSFTVGGEKDDEALAAADARKTRAAVTVHRFTIAAIACALVSLVVASIAQVRERHRYMTMSAIGCAALAITWQYVAIGIAVGVGVAVIVIIIGVFNP